MKTIRDLLEQKGGEIWSISPESTVYDAVALMAEKDIGALMVMDHGKPAGIFSERDYARKIVLEGRSSKTTKVKDIMSSKVVYIDIDKSIEDCMALMTDKRFRHMPVLENGNLAGVISIGDLVKTIIEEQQFMIDQLASYIAS